MRYADGPTVHSDIHIDAPPSEVWALVTDIHLPARLSPELQRVEWLDGATGATLGARFAGYNRHPLIGEWRTVSHVVELTDERLFGWAVTDADGRFGEPVTDPAGRLATWRFELTPEAGGTLVRQSAELGPARSGVSLAIEGKPEAEEAIVAARLKDLRSGIEATLNGVKDLAEGRR
ncbi:SRPBCC family protein [Streptomyces syringium]|uniref:SRPBCC family protein n=1 Tax=Streptomyces syringium TaxID=76729 RepID=UPI003AB07CCF